MKTPWILPTLLTAMLALSSTVDAAVIYLGANINVPTDKPINAIVVDGNGNTYEKVYYYNPALCGVDIGSSWDADSTSVFFPDYNVRYLWSNGYWLDENGYYWTGGHRYYYDYPGWSAHWGLYWNNHWHDSWHSHWYDHHDDAHWHYSDHEHWHDHWHHH